MNFVPQTGIFIEYMFAFGLKARALLKNWPQTALISGGEEVQEWRLEPVGIWKLNNRNPVSLKVIVLHLTLDK